ncbi:MAG TPA: ATP-binding cassette domain-containing protein [Verrucomicrobiae bacterium]
MNEATQVAVPPIEMHALAAAHEQAPGVPAIEDVNWRVGAGEFWVVGGLHHSGKSVLLTAAAGINRPLRGQLRLFGAEPEALHEDELFRHLLRIGLVFENDGRLFTRMTVAENVALPLLYHANGNDVGAETQVRAVLEATALLDFADTPAASLPRHLRQRVGLARALALSPEVLLVDNPLSRLPLREAGWWLGFLRQLAAGHSITGRRPMTIVATADELRPWCDCAQHFAVLDQRRLKVLGARHELEACGEPLIRELLTA